MKSTLLDMGGKYAAYRLESERAGEVCYVLTQGPLAPTNAEEFQRTLMASIKREYRYAKIDDEKGIPSVQNQPLNAMIELLSILKKFKDGRKWNLYPAILDPSSTDMVRTASRSK